jgi:hypothetical protein
MARLDRRIWFDPAWRALTNQQQLFIMMCMLFGQSGAITDARLMRKTGWSLEWITARRLEMIGSPFERYLAGNPKRRKVSKTISAFVFARDNFNCVVCGDTENLTVDHIHPVSRGGSDDLENLQTLCKSCNSRKGNRIA